MVRYNDEEYIEFKKKVASQYTYDELLGLWPEDMVIRFKGAKEESNAD